MAGAPHCGRPCSSGRATHTTTGGASASTRRGMRRRKHSTTGGARQRRVDSGFRRLGVGIVSSAPPSSCSPRCTQQPSLVRAPPVLPSAAAPPLLVGVTAEGSQSGFAEQSDGRSSQCEGGERDGSGAKGCDRLAPRCFGRAGAALSPDGGSQQQESREERRGEECRVTEGEPTHRPRHN